jgi:hypothetical protein
MLNPLRQVKPCQIIRHFQLKSHRLRHGNLQSAKKTPGANLFRLYHGHNRPEITPLFRPIAVQHVRARRAAWLLRVCIPRQDVATCLFTSPGVSRLGQRAIQSIFYFFP